MKSIYVEHVHANVIALCLLMSFSLLLTTSHIQAQDKFDYGGAQIPIGDAKVGKSNSNLPSSSSATSTQPSSNQITVPTNSMPAEPKSSGKTSKNKNYKNNVTYQPEQKSNYIEEHKWIQNPSSGNYHVGLNKIPAFSDDLYEVRLANIPSLVRLEYNPLVRKFIDMYVMQRRDQVKRMLSKMDMYFPVFEAALDRHDLPTDLKYLPVILSALIPHAKSKSGAAGLWQLPYGTANLYGLEANSYIDERYDPYLSTEVAVMHIENLYKKYRDWHLVIAAYNCGEGTVNKAIRQAGGTNDYWVASQYLPMQARAYVPLFIAAAYVMNYYPEHNLHKYEPPYSFYATDTISVKNTLNLKEVAAYLGMTLEELQFLNPAIKRNILPRSSQGVPLTLPVSKIDLCTMYLGNINSKNREIVINKAEELEKVNLPEDNPWNFKMTDYDVTYVPIKVVTDDLKILDYYVEGTETIDAIANKFDCTVEDIMHWNDLQLRGVYTTQHLYIVIPESHEELYHNITVRKITLEEAESKKERKSYDMTYTVQTGDNLYSIARQFSGISAENIRDYNNLSNNDLDVGMKLKIPVKE